MPTKNMSKCSFCKKSFDPLIESSEMAHSKCYNEDEERLNAGRCVFCNAPEQINDQCTKCDRVEYKDYERLN